MNLNERCERCDLAVYGWLVYEWRLEIGELRRKPHLCPTCTDVVVEVLRAALRPVTVSSSQS